MYRTFEKLVDPFAPFEEKTPPGTYFAYLKTQMEPFRKWMPWMLVTGLIVAVMESGLIFYSGRIIDLMTEAGASEFWSRHSFELTVAILFILIARPLLICLQRLFLEQTLAGNLQDQVRWRAHKHMLGQSSAFFQNDFAGRLSNRVMQLGGAVEDSVYMAFEGIWYFVVYVIGATLILTQIDARLAVPMLVWTVIYGSYTYWVAIRVAVASEKWSAGRSLVTGRVVDAYANIESVKLFADNHREEDYARHSMRRHRVRFHRFLRLMTELSLGLNIINGLLIVGVTGAAIWLWQLGTVSIGEVAIMWVTIRLFEHAGVIREGLQSVAVEHGVKDASSAPALNVANAEIKFEGIEHHYGRESGGLDGVTLTIKAGEKVGLIGRSGAGKSSLVNLLLRFRDVEKGQILIDDQNIVAVTQESLRRQIGMVTQDSSLLHRSVRANILYGAPEASEAEMIQAAHRAEAHEFILDLEDPQGRRGYDAHVGERGVKLSGGQRQRIAIARVILKDAPILMLDEATSALDSEVEAAIQETLYGVMEGKTVIAIAHRLSTIAKMDRIIVMDAGRIVEEGSHEVLLDQDGLYASFWKRQSGGFLGLETAAE